MKKGSNNKYSPFNIEKLPVRVINAKSLRDELINMIKTDKKDPSLRKNDIWYEWNMSRSCIHAIDTKEQKEHQLKNYDKMGFSIAETKPIMVGNYNCNLIILRKDPDYMPTYNMHNDLSSAFSLSIGWMKAVYEHIIIEVPSEK